jgi:Ca-activated chloride channel family protein
MVIALELTGSMAALDQPPSRLERAKHKIRDLLALRQGARTAVIGYAGSAHAVLQLTDDTALIELYLDALSTEVMPLTGDRPDLAVALARQMLATETAAGTVLFMTDGIDRSHATRFESVFTGSADQLLILALGTADGGLLVGADGPAPPVDRAGIDTVARAAGGWATAASVDQSDVAALDRRIRRHLVNAIGDDEDLQWRDAGYALVWPLALLSLAWFRRGWTIQWR